jgi:hypothetical protein
MDGLTGYVITNNAVETETCELFGAGGTLDVGTPGAADLGYLNTGSVICGTNSTLSDGIFPASTATGILTIGLT